MIKNSKTNIFVFDFTRYKNLFLDKLSINFYLNKSFIIAEDLINLIDYLSETLNKFVNQNIFSIFLKFKLRTLIVTLDIN